MCGIVAARHDWLLRQGLDPRTAMRAAVGELRWRGPDGEGVERIGPWWLGCARLAITQPHSRQPVVRRGGRSAAVLNGAITNARELWARLLPPAERRTAPPNDAWLPLLAVAAGDRDVLANLRGHHAYLVVDARTGELVFGQDRFGEKPLVGFVERRDAGPTLVALASTTAALRRLGVAAPLPLRALAEWFRFGWSFARTVRVDARHRLVEVPRRGEPFVAEGDRTGWCAPWRPARTLPFRPTPPPTDLRARLIAGTARCVDTTAAVGLSLSGGVDSSCLALALRELGRTVPAYQFRAIGAPARERAAAALVAHAAGLPLREVDAGPAVLDALPRLTELADQPLGDPSILAVHAVARAARADGVEVLLGGEGADELLLGYRRYRALARLPHAPWLGRLAPQLSMRYAARAWRAVAAPDPATALLAVTPPAFADLVLAPALGLRRCWRDAGARPAIEPQDRVLAARDADLDGYLRRDLLPKVDIALMAAGVEGRCPYLECGVDAFGRTRAALGKAPLWTAFAGELPLAVRRLPKHGFALPLDRWFRGELPWLDLLAEPRTRHRPHLRPGGVGRAIDLHRTGRAALGHGLYLLVACELFLRHREAARRETLPGAGPDGG